MEKFFEPCLIQMHFHSTDRKQWQKQIRAREHNERQKRVSQHIHSTHSFIYKIYNSHNLRLVATRNPKISRGPSQPQGQLSFISFIQSKHYIQRRINTVPAVFIFLSALTFITSFISFFPIVFSIVSYQFNK